MQEQKAENTGRQFCSCFYQLLGIGGPEARPWQDASWGVRVGTYVSLAYHLLPPPPPLPLSLSSPRSLAILPVFFFSSLASPPFFLHLDRLDDSFLPRIHLPSLPSRSFRALVLFIEAGCLRVPLGSSGSPSTVHSLHGMPYIYAR